MKKVSITLSTLIILAVLGWSSIIQSEPQSDTVRLLDLETNATLDKASAVDALRSKRIVLVGEFHDNAQHHKVQLEVIRMLHEAGLSVSIGLEMFRQDSQEFLNRWVDGGIDEVRFKPIYLDNWNFDWSLYRPIFTFARDNQIPMVGLNVSRRITAQVAYHGFQSLSPAQRGDLDGITCDVTPEYRDFIQRAYGAHGHGGMQFERFCEAQLVWDTAMAMRAVDYVRDNPATIMVVITGSGHARKLGIPTQIQKLGTEPFAVILPETPGYFDTFLMTTAEADYLFLK